MKVKKVILSFFLLFVYGLGFAHSLIPHCHEGDKEHYLHKVTGHHHHQHFGNTAHGHEHHKPVLHRDHLDKDLYDLLLCILSDMEHHGNDNEFVHFFQIEDFKPSKNETVRSFLCFSGYAAHGLNPLYETDPVYFKRPKQISRTNFIVVATLRGPPFRMC